MILVSGDTYGTPLSIDKKDVTLSKKLVGILKSIHNSYQKKKKKKKTHHTSRMHNLYKKW